MTRRPRLLDLYCGAGGAAMGYHLAGFDVTGVDHRPQPRYPFPFVCGDALEATAWAGCFDAVHASPPCQAYSKTRAIQGNRHPDLLDATRVLLERAGVPWIIENVPGAPMRKDLILCGSMFGLGDAGDGLERHRWFEYSDPSIVPLVWPCAHRDAAISVFGHGTTRRHDAASWRRAMGIDWMTRDELGQAIPPAYTQLIGETLLGNGDTMPYQRERFILPAPDGPLPDERPEQDALFGACPECGGSGRRGLTIHHDDYGYVYAVDAGPPCHACGGSGAAGK